MIRVPVTRRLTTHLGFTLIELMIVVGILSILGAIAVPAYTGYVAKAKRAEARAQLLQASQFMQRFYAANDRYDADRAGNLLETQMPANLKQAPAEGVAQYTLTFPAGSTTATGYTLTMAPVSGLSMASDACGSFRITSTGVRSVTGTLPRDTCWK